MLIQNGVQVTKDEFRTNLYCLWPLSSMYVCTQSGFVKYQTNAFCNRHAPNMIMKRNTTLYRKSIRVQ